MGFLLNNDILSLLILKQSKKGLAKNANGVYNKDSKASPPNQDRKRSRYKYRVQTVRDHCSSRRHPPGWK